MSIPGMDKVNTGYVRLSDGAGATETQGSGTPRSGRSSSTSGAAPEALQGRPPQPRGDGTPVESVRARHDGPLDLHLRMRLGPLHVNQPLLSVGQKQQSIKTVGNPFDEQAPNGTKTKTSQWTLDVMGHTVLSTAPKTTVEPRKGEPGPVRAALEHRLPGLAGVHAGQPRTPLADPEAAIAASSASRQGLISFGRGRTTTKTAADPDNPHAPHGTKEKTTQWSLKVGNRTVFETAPKTTSEPRKGESTLQSILHRLRPSQSDGGSEG